ncbi:hypothetical protein HDF13_001358 [Edaphobacter lichenicola]|uniref:Uncharacterized protein n=1 Tax=Tunturiibacter gelidiferens TaxID=3069689 RepID=A0ACC5NWR6_9BACT|nr:hypothetical protein [Edaphobacter lichenicola]
MSLDPVFGTGHAVRQLAGRAKNALYPLENLNGQISIKSECPSYSNFGICNFNQSFPLTSMSHH